ncbi:MAG: murein hydrolase activator EnvC family protein [Elusimicrobiota bacterium]
MNFKKTGIIFTGLIPVLFLSTVFAAPPEKIKKTQNKIETQESQLLQLNKEIEKYERNLRELTDRENELFGKINSIKENLKQQSKKLNETKIKIADVKKKIDKLNKNLVQAREEGKKYSKYLKDSLKFYYYKNFSEKMLPWYSSYLGADKNFCYYAGELVKAPAQKYTGIQKKIQEISNLTRDLEKENNNLVKLKETQLSMQKKYQSRREEQLEILKKVKARRENQKNEIQNLKEERKELKNLITSLKKEVKNLERLEHLSQYLVEAKGELPWPVKGEVVSRFGKQQHPRLDTYIYNRGIKIEVSESREVKSVAAGEVVFADEFQGRGKMIVVDHGEDYYSIYGDLGDIDVGVGIELKPLTVLGSTGNSPLYFEIGKGSTPENPLDWLERKK